MTQFFGIGHYSRTGKDTFADYLISELAKVGVSAIKVSFASPIKKIAHELFGWAGVREEAYYNTPDGESSRTVVLEKIGMSPVDLWVRIGNDAFRDNVYENTWIDAALRREYDADVVVIPDMRYPNEVEAIRNLGGVIVKIVRPGVIPKQTTADQALIGFDDWDYIIGGSGKLKELKSWASEFAYWLGHGWTMPTQTPGEIARAIEVERKSIEEAIDL